MNFHSRFDSHNQGSPTYHFREDDVVLVRAVVTRAGSDTLQVQVAGHVLTIGDGDVDAVDVQAFRVGDCVTGGECPILGTVIGIHGEDVWVHHTDGNRKTWSADELLRLSPEAAAAAGLEVAQ